MRQSVLETKQVIRKNALKLYQQKFLKSHAPITFYLPKKIKAALSSKAKQDPAFGSMSSFLCAQVEHYLKGEAK